MPRRKGGGLYPRVPRFQDAPIDEETMIDDKNFGQPEIDDDDTVDLGARFHVPPPPKVARLMTNDHADAPLDGPQGVGTDPDLTTDIFLVDTTIPIRSFMYMFKKPDTSLVVPAVIGAGPDTGLAIIIWLRNPRTRQWGKTQQFVIPFDTWVTSSGDFNGGELYYQILATSIVTDGAVELHILEQA